MLRNLYLIFIRKKTACVWFASNFLNDLHVCQLFWASLTYQKNEQKSSADYILNLCSLDFFFQSYTMNITTVQGFETFMSSLKSKTFHPTKEGSGVDLVLSCVDNYEARMAVNQV